MSLVTLAPGAGEAIKALLSAKGVQGPVRIEVQFTGCCGPSLGLMVDTVRESDLVEDLEGLTFAISPETHELVGEVTISCADDPEREEFVLSSSKPISEWDGFAASSIRIPVSNDLQQ
jgi:Fe-S cluster assembly iron-binding protein IscA